MCVMLDTRQPQISPHSGILHVRRVGTGTSLPHTVKVGLIMISSSVKMIRDKCVNININNPSNQKNNCMDKHSFTHVHILPSKTDDQSRVLPPIRSEIIKKYKKIIDKAQQEVIKGAFKGAEFETAAILCSNHSMSVFYPDVCPKYAQSSKQQWIQFSEIYTLH